MGADWEPCTLIELGDDKPITHAFYSFTFANVKSEENTNYDEIIASSLYTRIEISQNYGVDLYQDAKFGNWTEMSLWSLWFWPFDNDLLSRE